MQRLAPVTRASCCVAMLRERRRYEFADHHVVIDDKHASVGTYRRFQPKGRVARSAPRQACRTLFTNAIADGRRVARLLVVGQLRTSTNVLVRTSRFRSTPLT